MRDRFRHLNKGLAVVLVFIGSKMLITDLWHVPTALSLAVILAALTLSVLASPRAARPSGAQ
jgi:tellurite resistance protein TerC